MTFGQTFAPITNRSGRTVGYTGKDDARFLLACGLIEQITPQDFAALVGSHNRVAMPTSGSGWGEGSYVVEQFAATAAHYRVADGYDFEHLDMARTRKREHARRMTEQDITERVNRVLDA